MKMTNNEAYDTLSLLVRLREKGKLGFVISKNIRILRNELSEYIAKRDEMIQRLGTKQNDTFKIEGQEKIDEFLSLIKEYSDIEIEFTPQLIDAETFWSGNLTSDQMADLSWMVKEEE